MATGGTLCEVLQVDPAARPQIIEAAYRRLAKMYHPDVTQARDAGTRMKEINAAYGVLRDPARRAAYDRQLQEQARPAPPPPLRYEPEEDADEDWDDEDEGWTA
jgi:DnaJ-class molecular chaperone